MPDLVTIGHIIMDIHFFEDKFQNLDEGAKTDNLSGGKSAVNVVVSASTNPGRC